jgi:hypothetical protein
MSTVAGTQSPQPDGDMAMAEEETPILDAPADLTAVSVERSTLNLAS